MSHIVLKTISYASWWDIKLINMILMACWMTLISIDKQRFDKVNRPQTLKFVAFCLGYISDWLVVVSHYYSDFVTEIVEAILNQDIVFAVKVKFETNNLYVHRRWV